MQDSDYQLFSDSVLGELSIGGRREAEACERALEDLSLWDLRDAHPAQPSRAARNGVSR